MKRLSFNGGELSPELSLRCDLDVYSRGCSCIENFDVSQMGGVRRRKGMRPVSEALPHSKIFGYEYTTSQRFLVELGADSLRVFSSAGEIVYQTSIPPVDPFSVRCTQVNALMLFASPNSPVMQLRLDASGQWSYSAYTFKNVPWRYTDYRDEAVTVGRAINGSYNVSFASATSALEKQCCAGDLLRISYWTDPQEASATSAQLLANVTQITALSSSSVVPVGTKIAMRGESTIQYYSCIQDWNGSGNDAAFVAGLTSPANYSGCFIRAEAVSTASTLTPIRALTSAMNYKKGDMIAFESGYWEFYTCIKAFNSSAYVSGSTSPADYKGYFIRGLAIGEALPSKGTWKFACSGGWIGEYEVRRNPDTHELNDEWETLGASFSPMGANINTAITGDEQQEECYLRLFITRSYYLGTNIQDGFPQDYCGNKLVVDSYKHDIQLRYSVTTNSAGEVISSSWARAERIALDLTGSISSKDWSWQAFSEKYGYPQLIETYGKRVVLAATREQPVTIWMSRTDDLNNFELGKTDDAGIALTMAAKTQNPICWLLARSEKIYLGTTDSEHVISPSSGKIATPTNLNIESHGYIGSANLPALTASDKIAYCERGSGRLYQFGYSYESDSYVSRDLTVFSDHILRDGGGVVDATYIKKPYAKAVFVLANGTVALMTYNSLHEVNAWHRYTTQGRVLSCAMLPNGEKEDSLFFIVERDGGRFIEVIDSYSGYVDGGVHDYVSTLSTSAITIPDARAQKDNTPPIFFYLAESTLTDGIEISTDGVKWTRPATTKTELLKGWHQLISPGAWRWETFLSLRVRGDRGLHILAMQR